MVIEDVGDGYGSFAFVLHELHSDKQACSSPSTLYQTKILWLALELLVTSFIQIPNQQPQLARPAAVMVLGVGSESELTADVVSYNSLLVVLNGALLFIII